MKRRGIFITIEKTREGLGGTTQSLLLKDGLEKQGYNVVLTKEPGGTPLGVHIRRLLLEDGVKVCKAAELFLFMADRAQNYKENIKPGLKQGAIVISDRFHDSTRVYQGAVAGWNTSLISELHHAATGLLIPDLTIVLDGTPHRSLSASDKIESRGATYHSKVRDAMLDLAKRESRFAIINTDNQTVSEVHASIMQAVMETFPYLF